MKSQSALTIQITCTDGRAAIFEQQDSGAVLTLLGQLAPGRVFSNPYITIVESRSLTVFPTASIVRIDLSTNLVLDWDFYMGIHDAYEVSSDEFERLATIEEGTPRGASVPLTVLAVIEMVNAKPVRLVIVFNERQETMIHTDFDNLLRRFLSAPNFHVRRVEGGGIIVNPRHILQVKFYPCPPEPPTGAWKAESASSVSS